MLDNSGYCKIPTTKKGERIMDMKEEVWFRQRLSHHIRIGPSEKQKFAIALFLALGDLLQRKGKLGPKAADMVDKILIDGSYITINDTKDAASLFFDGPLRRFYRRVHEIINARSLAYFSSLTPDTAQFGVPSFSLLPFSNGFFQDEYLQSGYLLHP